MANTQALCTSFKSELMNGSHAFGTQAANAVRTVTTKDIFKFALFLVSASRGAGDTVYNTTGEVATGGSYTQGGVALPANANAPTVTSGTAHWTPSAPVVFATVTIATPFDCAVLYNDSSSTKLEIAVFTFGSQTVTGGNFTLNMPTNDQTTGLIRIA